MSSWRRICHWRKKGQERKQQLEDRKQQLQEVEQQQKKKQQKATSARSAKSLTEIRQACEPTYSRNILEKEMLRRKNLALNAKSSFQNQTSVDTWKTAEFKEEYCIMKKNEEFNEEYGRI